MADAKAHAVCVPNPSAMARRYMRSHHNSMDDVRKNPASSHQPPCASGSMILMPAAGGGGSSASQGNCRTNSIGLQFTDAHMFRPMISIAKKPNTNEAMPV